MQIFGNLFTQTQNNPTSPSKISTAGSVSATQTKAEKRVGNGGSDANWNSLKKMVSVKAIEQAVYLQLETTMSRQGRAAAVTHLNNIKKWSGRAATLAVSVSNPLMFTGVLIYQSISVAGEIAQFNTQVMTTNADANYRANLKGITYRKIGG